MKELPDEHLYPHSELTHKIIVAAMRVHTALGPGYVEKIYENAMVLELTKMGISVQQQVRYPVYYDGRQVGVHVLDLVADGKVYIELKCQVLAKLDTAQAVSGLKASGLGRCAHDKLWRAAFA